MAMTNLPNSVVYLVLTAGRLAVVARDGEAVLETSVLGAGGEGLPPELARYRGRSAILLLELAEIEVHTEPLPGLERKALMALARRKLEKQFPEGGFLSCVGIGKDGGGGNLAHMVGVEAGPIRALLAWLERGGLSVVGVCAFPQLADTLATRLAASAGFAPLSAGLVAIWMPGAFRVFALRDGRIAAARYLHGPEEAGVIPGSLEDILGEDLEETWALMRRARDGTSYPWSILVLPETWRARFGSEGRIGGFSPRILSYAEAARGLRAPGRLPPADVWRFLAACAHSLPADDMLPGGRPLRATGRILAGLKVAGVALFSISLLALGATATKAWQQHDRLERARATSGVVEKGEQAAVPGENPGQPHPAPLPALSALEDERKRRIAGSIDIAGWLEKLATLGAAETGLITRGVRIEPLPPGEGIGHRLTWRLEGAAPALVEVSALDERLSGLVARVSALPGIRGVRWTNNPLDAPLIGSGSFTSGELALELVAEIRP